MREVWDDGEWIFMRDEADAPIGWTLRQRVEYSVVGLREASLLYDLLKRMLARKAENRPSIQEVLRHPVSSLRTPSCPCFIVRKLAVATHKPYPET